MTGIERTVSQAWPAAITQVRPPGCVTIMVQLPDLEANTSIIWPLFMSPDVVEQRPCGIASVDLHLKDGLFKRLLDLHQLPYGPHNPMGEEDGCDSIQ